MRMPCPLTLTLPLPMSIPCPLPLLKLLNKSMKGGGGDMGGPNFRRFYNFWTKSTSTNRFQNAQSTNSIRSSQMMFKPMIGSGVEKEPNQWSCYEYYFFNVSVANFCSTKFSGKKPILKSTGIEERNLGSNLQSRFTSPPPWKYYFSQNLHFLFSRTHDCSNASFKLCLWALFLIWQHNMCDQFGT